MNQTDTINSGIRSRQKQAAGWLRKRGFKGKYLLVSTKKGVRSQGSEVRGRRLIVDLYTPLPLEKKVSFRWWNPLDWRVRQVARNNIKSYLLAGDHFLVANRRQREYWIRTAGNLGVKLTEKDISVLPTGAFAIRKKEEGIRKKEKNVVLWFGGIYPWMDPEPLVEAFSRICREYPEWKLRILGGWQPGTGYKDRYEKLINKAKASIPDSQLQIVDWQKNEDLGKFLRDVSFAVHLVKNSPEDYYAHRVRLLTLLCAGIPVLTSGRDAISELLVKEKAGVELTDSPEDLDNTLRRILRSKSEIERWQKNTGKIQEKFIRSEIDEGKNIGFFLLKNKV